MDLPAVRADGGNVRAAAPETQLTVKYNPPRSVCNAHPHILGDYSRRTDLFGKVKRGEVQYLSQPFLRSFFERDGTRRMAKPRRAVRNEPTKSVEVMRGVCKRKKCKTYINPFCASFLAGLDFGADARHEPFMAKWEARWMYQPFLRRLLTGLDFGASAEVPCGKVKRSRAATS